MKKKEREKKTIKRYKVEDLIEKKSKIEGNLSKKKDKNNLKDFFVSNLSQSKKVSPPLTKSVTEPKREGLVPGISKRIQKEKFDKKEAMILHKSDPAREDSPLEAIEKLFDLQKIKLGLLYRFKIIGLIFAVLMIICGAISTTHNKVTYTARANIIYKEQKKFVSNNRHSKFKIKQLPVDSSVLTLKSPVNAQRTVNTLKLPFPSRTIQNNINVKKKVSNKNKSKATPISISLENMPSRKWAIIGLNTYVQNALFNNDFVYRSKIKEAIRQYKKQIIKSKSLLDKTNNELAKYPLAQKIKNSKTEYELYVNKIEFINEKINETDLELSEMDAQLDSYASLLSNLNDESFGNVTAKNILKKQIYDLEFEKTKLVSKLGPNHPKRLQLEKELADLKRRVRSVKKVANYNPIIAEYEEEEMALKLKKKITLQKLNAYKLKLNELKRTHQDISKRSNLIETLQDKKKSAELIFKTLNESMEDAKLALENNLSDFEVIDKATHATKVGESKKKMITLAIPFVIAAIIALCSISFEIFDKYFRTPKELEIAFDIPCIASVDYQRNTENLFEKSFIQLQEMFAFFSKNAQKNEKVFLFTSTNTKEGKSTLIHNYAKYCALYNYKVAIVCLYNPPQITDSVVNLNLSFFNDVKSFQLKSEQTITFFQGQFSDVELVRLVQSDQMKQFFDALKGTFDFVFIDSKPTKLSTSEVLFADFSDEVICIVGSSITPKSHLKETVGIFKKSHIKCNGLVLNMTNPMYSSVQNPASVIETVVRKYQEIRGLVKRSVEKFKKKDKIS